MSLVVPEIRRSWIARVNPLAKLVVALCVGVTLVLSIDVVSAGIVVAVDTVSRTSSAASPGWGDCSSTWPTGPAAGRVAISTCCEVPASAMARRATVSWSPITAGMTASSATSKARASSSRCSRRA